MTAKEKIDVYEVVKKLIGEIEPVGSSEIDAKRFENLKAMTGLIERLIDDTYEVGKYRNNHQASMKKAAEYADKFSEALGLE